MLKPRILVTSSSARKQQRLPESSLHDFPSALLVLRMKMDALWIPADPFCDPTRLPKGTYLTSEIPRSPFGRFYISGRG